MARSLAHPCVRAETPASPLLLGSRVGVPPRPVLSYKRFRTLPIRDRTDLASRNFQEADIKAGVRKGEKVLGAFLITREDHKGPLYVTYLRTSWTRGFLPLRTFRDKADRVYRDLDKLLALLRKDFAYPGEVSIFVAGDVALRRFRALLPTDRQALLLDGSMQPAEGIVSEDAPLG